MVSSNLTFVGDRDSMKDADTAQTTTTEIVEKPAFTHDVQTDYTDAEAKRVLRKVDWCLLPLLMGCYIISFIDKTLLNYSSIFGLQKALKLHGTQYSWLGSIFSFGYLISQPLSGFLIQRYPTHVAKIVTTAVFLWSALILLTPLCRDFKDLCCVRFFLGFLEGPVSPAWILFTGNWWTKREQAFRAAIWFCGTPLGNIIGGVSGYGLGSIHSKTVQSWQIFYLFFGSLSMVWAIILAICLPDNQANARFLNKEEKKIAIERVRENFSVTLEKHFKMKQCVEAFMDPAVWALWMISFAITLPSVAASSFSSLIVKGFGFSAVLTTVVSSVPASTIQILTLTISSYLTTRYPNSRLYASVITSIPPLIGAGLLHSLPTHNYGGRLAGYYLTFTHTAGSVFAYALVSSNVTGSTKKMVTSAGMFVWYSVGLIAGPQFFLSSQSPNYTTGFLMMIITYAIMVPLPLALRAYYVWENKRRDRKLLAEQDSGVAPPVVREDDWSDVTDWEDWRERRYVM